MVTEENSSVTIGVSYFIAAISALCGAGALVGKWLMDRNNESFKTIVETNRIQNAALASTASSLASIAAAMLTGADEARDRTRRLEDIERAIADIESCPLLKAATRDIYTAIKKEDQA